ncbi:hypothetical protein CONLIGDRAFT_631122 [Coniochaeta ligniaria NRRL 30616]|uniref:Secreted protein n=1 Tax=Coniochaeta ligniaria NRRL 30616 TaxID=1408157 RepID=A0A1J7JMV5_9PEZI|nr:hypothetical protein CONLIGDRAFT_631122 [Coniochaeta ligniaria NRRL 30616]
MCMAAFVFSLLRYGICHVRMPHYTCIPAFTSIIQTLSWHSAVTVKSGSQSAMQDLTDPVELLDDQNDPPCNSSQP